MKNTFFLVLLALSVSLVACKKEYTAESYNQELVDNFKMIDDQYQLCIKQVETLPKAAKKTLSELNDKIKSTKKKLAKIPAYEGEEDYLAAMINYLDFCENITNHGLKDYVEIKNKAMNDAFDDARIDLLQKELEREYNKVAKKVMTSSIQFCKFYNLEVDNDFWKRTA